MSYVCQTGCGKGEFCDNVFLLLVRLIKTRDVFPTKENESRKGLDICEALFGQFPSFSVGLSKSAQPNAFPSGTLTAATTDSAPLNASPPVSCCEALSNGFWLLNRSF